MHYRIWKTTVCSTVLNLQIEIWFLQRIFPGFKHEALLIKGGASIFAYEEMMAIIIQPYDYEKHKGSSLLTVPSLINVYTGFTQIVTHDAIKRSILILWLSAFLLTYLPLIGFGLYYKEDKCKRYRDAEEIKDIVYAYIFLIFGSTISICIVLCNISIIRELRRIGKSQHALVRRCSRSNMNNKYATAEELSFAKLMAAVCIIFIVCWMPQMVSIPMAQFYPGSKTYDVFGKIADLLMCAYFALDPYVYVLQRYLAKRTCKIPWRTSSKSNSGGQSFSLHGSSITATAINIHLHNFTPVPKSM